MPDNNRMARPQSAVASLLLLMMVAVNLRPFLTSVSSILEQLRTETGLGYHAASALTALPFVLMGVMAFVGAQLAKLVGERNAVAMALTLLAAGCGVRWWVQDGTGLIASAVVAGSGVAAIQALMPGVIKRLLPSQLGLAMGVYSAALIGGGALGAMASPWLASHGGWHLALAVWLLPALLALALWLYRVPAAISGRENPWRGSMQLCLKSRRAWLLALYFGATNSSYSSLVAWLPTFYREQDASPQFAANLLAALAAVQAIAALLLPLLAHGQEDRRPWLVLVLLCQICGLAGLAWAPQSAPWAWVVLAGIGLGGFFSLCLQMVLEHVSDAADAGRLAAFVQGMGFLLTAMGPWLMGWWRERGGHFASGWVWQLDIAAVMLLLTKEFSPTSYSCAMRSMKLK